MNQWHCSAWQWFLGFTLNVTDACELTVEQERRAKKYTRRERVTGRRLIYMYDGRYITKVEAK